MQTAAVGTLSLEYELRGEGDPVALVHAGVCADFFAPLASRLEADHRVLRPHRVGYAGSDGVVGPVDLAEQAGHLAGLMDAVGIERAHVVGHSSSACIALQLAADRPERVRSVAALDAARPATRTALQAEFAERVARPALARYGEGDVAGAVDAWMTGVCGPGYREPLEAAIPGAFAQAVADARTFFGQELLAVMQWSFGPDEARRVTCPVLAVVGERSHPVFAERRDLLLAWLPHAEPFDLPGATHLLHVENPDGMAAALRAFYAGVA